MASLRTRVGFFLIFRSFAKHDRSSLRRVIIIKLPINYRVFFQGTRLTTCKGSRESLLDLNIRRISRGRGIVVDATEKENR